MTHPLDQLAPYVDGSLAGRERVEVERHLASCAQCRSEVAAASEARTALRSMPEVAVPADLAAPALEAMAARATHPAGPPRWVRAMPLVAAAAVVALLAIITLPRLGGGDAASDGAGGQALATAPAARDLRLEVVSTDFDAASLQTEAQTSAARYADAGATTEPRENAAVASPAGTAEDHVAGPVRSSEALRCLRTAFEGFPGDPVRLVQASFDGTPAYLAFVLEGPGADQPADQMTVWVAARADCSIVSLTSVRL
jgi:anti-sigma factor RsiW